MSCSESVVYINVSIRSQLLCEVFLTFLHLVLSSCVSRICLVDAYRFAFLFRIEAEVLEQKSLARFQSFSLFVGVCAVRSELNLYAKCLGNIFLYLSQRQFRVYFAFRFTHVAHHYQCTTVSQHFLECRERTAYTCVISYFSVLIQWNIEVHANDCLLSGKIELIDFHLS